MIHVILFYYLFLSSFSDTKAYHLLNITGQSDLGHFLKKLPEATFMSLFINTWITLARICWQLLVQ